MKEISIFALQAVGHDFKMANIMYEVAEATGNVEVAIKKLLSIYEEPRIHAQAKRDGHVCTFKSYDPFKDRLTYTYNTIKKVYVEDKYVDDPTGVLVEKMNTTGLASWTADAIPE